MWWFCKCKHLTHRLPVDQRLDQGDCRKAIWAWSSELRRAVYSPLLALHRRPDLPHRSLPGQGNGAEPNGAQVSLTESTRVATLLSNLQHVHWKNRYLSKHQKAGCGCSVGLETASSDQSGTGTMWPVWFLPLRSHLALKGEEAISMILESFGESATKS